MKSHIFSKKPTQAQNPVISVLLRQETVTWGGRTWAAPVSGRGIKGGGSGYAALLAHAGGVLYGTELGSVTLKVGFFCFPIKYSTHRELQLAAINRELQLAVINNPV
jgi:hypothetical protein